jgi:antitoxin (DNA-binding transcriptional repressor) of toxin-antitoxin stability system
VYNINKSIIYNFKLNRRDDIMSISTTELKVNLGKYLTLAATEDIYITRNGKVVAKLSNPYQDSVDVAKSLFGVLPADITLEEAREERLNKI